MVHRERVSSFPTLCEKDMANRATLCSGSGCFRDLEGSAPIGISLSHLDANRHSMVKGTVLWSMMAEENRDEEKERRFFLEHLGFQTGPRLAWQVNGLEEMLIGLNPVQKLRNPLLG